MKGLKYSENIHFFRRPRMRICFDPETEIPKLQKWFAENHHPTRQQVKMQYNDMQLESLKLLKCFKFLGRVLR